MTPTYSPRPSSSRLAWTLFWTVATMSCALVIATFWPGHLDTDSVHQLDLARRNVDEPWPPPMMSWVWRAVDRVYPGAGGMLIAQNAMLFGGVALVVGASLGPGGALIVPVIGFFPPVLGLLNTIYKDTQMGAALALGFGLLAWSNARSSRWLMLVAPLPLTYAVGVRYNALAAVLPMFVWWGLLVRDHWFPRMRHLWGVIAGLTVLLATQLTVFAVVLHRAPGHTFDQLGLQEHDLAAISLARRENYFPSFMIARGVTLEFLQAHFRPETADSLYWADPARFTVGTREEAGALVRSWTSAIRGHPLAYLVHRLRVFSVQLGIGGMARHPLFANDMSQMAPGFVRWRQQMGVDARPGPWDQRVMGWLWHLVDTPLYAGWLYLAVAIAPALLRRVRRAPRASSVWWVLAISSLAMVAPLIVIGVSAEFRYVWWSVIAGLLTPVTAGGGFRKLADARTAAPAPPTAGVP